MIQFFSGGAEGSDTVFGNLAEKLGHTVTHFSFKGHKGYSAKPEHAYILKDQELKRADHFLIRANKSLGRTFPSSNHGVNCLLRRNWYQVLNSGYVFAACLFENIDGDYASEVMGGTAWAIQMFIDQRYYDTFHDAFGLERLPIHILNVKTNEWYSHHSTFPCNSKPEKIVTLYQKMEVAPKLSFEFGESWTGIGTRKLTSANEHAIMSLNS